MSEKMETVREWVNAWIEANGHEKCDGDRKLILEVGDGEEVYFGHFLDVPEELLDRRVNAYARILESSDPARNDAFKLQIDRSPLIDQINAATDRRQKDSYLKSLQATLDVCDMIMNNRHAFPTDQVAKAEKLKMETLENIRKRESIPFERRMGVREEGR